MGKPIKKEDTTSTETETKNLQIHHQLKITDENSVVLSSYQLMI